MKKILKIIGIILVLFILAVCGLAYTGNKSIKNEEKIAQNGIESEIFFEGTIEEAAKQRDELQGKHIVIHGIVSDKTTKRVDIKDADFTVEGYSQSIPEEIQSGYEIKIDGVCTYNSSSRITMRLCEITVIKAASQSLDENNSEIEASVAEEPSEDLSEEATEEMLEFNQEEFEKVIKNAYRKDCIKEIVYDEDKGKLKVDIYFKRYSSWKLEKWKDEALLATWESLKSVHTYFESINQWENLKDLTICAYIPDDGKEGSGNWEFMSRYSGIDLANVDYQSDDFTQVGSCAHTYKWNNILHVDNYQYQEFVKKTTEQGNMVNTKDSSNDGNFEWYKTYKVFLNSSTSNQLELIGYDNAFVDVAINGLTCYSFNSTEGNTLDDGSITFNCGEGIDLIYYPNDRNSIQLKSGEYAGYYYPEN